MRLDWILLTMSEQEHIEQVAYDPDSTVVESRNIHQLMEEHGIDIFEALHRRTVEETDGEQLLTGLPG